ncbi:MAG: hypothetical protein MJ113_01145 [Lachnospiraceae bacterium]|nr:hypothetical protein [Lachnospiraceae bacterium]
MTGKDKADVSRDTNLLINKGLLKKNLNGDNAYRAKLILSEEGKKVTENLVVKISEAVRQVGLNTTEENRNNFCHVQLEQKALLMRRIA